MPESASRSEAPTAERRWRQRLGRLRRLDPADRWLLVRAWLLLPVVDGALRLLPFRRVERLFGSRVSRRRRGPVEEARASAIGRLVAAAARHHLYDVGCLPRALALRHLLARRGVASVLRFGARRPAGGALTAHAWLEDEGGLPLGEARDVGERFPVLEPSGPHHGAG